MIKIKFKILEKVIDESGVTVVMRRRETEKTRWWKRAKVKTQKILTLWTTDDPTLIRRDDFTPLQDWLIVNPAFRHYKEDCRTIDIKGILKDKQIKVKVNKVLTF